VGDRGCHGSAAKLYRTFYIVNAQEVAYSGMQLVPNSIGGYDADSYLSKLKHWGFATTGVSGCQ
jgi:hypothetical protein